MNDTKGGILNSDDGFNLSQEHWVGRKEHHLIQEIINHFNACYDHNVPVTDPLRNHFSDP